MFTKLYLKLPFKFHRAEGLSRRVFTGLIKFTTNLMSRDLSLEGARRDAPGHGPQSDVVEAARHQVQEGHLPLVVRRRLLLHRDVRVGQHEPAHVYIRLRGSWVPLWLPSPCLGWVAKQASGRGTPPPPTCFFDCSFMFPLLTFPAPISRFLWKFLPSGIFNFQRQHTVYGTVYCRWVGSGHWGSQLCKLSLPGGGGRRGGTREIFF